MNLVDLITDALWEGFEAEGNACVDRSLDLIDTGGTYETFSMERVARHLIDRLELREEFVVRKITRLGTILCNESRWVTPYRHSPRVADSHDQEQS